MNTVQKRVQVKMTKAGFEKLQGELTERKEKTRMKIAKKLSQAAEFGDRSENVSYSSAMEERDANEARISELEAMLSDVVIVKEDKHNKDCTVSVGDTVTLSINGKEGKYEMVGAGEGDMPKCKLSADSPIGLAILGKKEGESAKVDAPIGKMNIKITKIS